MSSLDVAAATLATFSRPRIFGWLLLIYSFQVTYAFQQRSAATASAAELLFSCRDVELRPMTLTFKLNVDRRWSQRERACQTSTSEVTSFDS